ncbi:MAG: hypothetical protein HGA45_23680, partial [Chloroflexales bacterium]|nr:hypothetical protein [Chloroflexales bacterium]
MDHIDLLIFNTAHVVTSSYGCQRCHSATTLNGTAVTAATATFHVN